MIAWLRKTLIQIGDYGLTLGEILGYIVRGKIDIGETLSQMEMGGVRSLPIVSLSASFIGMAVSVQFAREIIGRFGAGNLIGGFVSIAMLRELAPVFVAIVITGNIGAAVTAEIGTMKVTDQVDAMKVFRIQPLQYLVVPRLVAMAIVGPILTIYGAFLSILSGQLFTEVLLHVPAELFWNSVRETASLTDITNMVIKSFVFSIAIALIASLNGLATRGSSGGCRSTNHQDCDLVPFGDFYAQLFPHLPILPNFGGLMPTNIPLENATTPSPLIALQDIHLSYQSTKVLNGISLEVWPDEVVAIVGPSGTGKSTLLKIITGLLTPDSGDVVLQTNNIGLAFQDGALFSSLSVAENISIVLERTTDLSVEDIDQRIQESLELVGLSDAREKFPNELSGGMQKRVGIARALAIEPDIMLYDEPSAGLDPILAHKLEDDLRRINRKRKLGSVLVTHELPTIQNLADRVVMLYHGRIVYTGSKDDFMTTGEPYALQFRTRREAGPIEV